jgi:APA family basic amino acid/polyamine antiporter
MAFGVAVGVGSMVGVGILRIPGVVLGHVGTPALALAVWVAGAVYVLLCANYMAELGTSIPRSGGPYAYAERTLGRGGGVIVGWSDFANSIYAMALLAVALAEYIGQLIPGLHLPTAALAALLIGLFTTINAIGVDLASGTQKLTSLVKLMALWALIGGCFVLAPEASGHAGLAALVTGHAFTWLGAIAAFQLVLGAYNGWAAPAYFGGEARDGRRDLPRALLFGALLVAATYIGVNAAVLHTVPASTLVASKLPAADALEQLTAARGWSVGAGLGLVTLLAALSLPSTLHAVTMQTSRTFHAMSQDGLFFRWAARVNRAGSPVNAALVCGAIAAVLAAGSSFESLFATFTVFVVLNNLILLIGVVRLRRAEPGLERPFRIILYPWALIPIVLVDLAVFAGFAWAHPRQCLAGAGVGLVLYLAYRVLGRGGPQQEPAR